MRELGITYTAEERAFLAQRYRPATNRDLVLALRAQLINLRERLPALGDTDDEQTILLEHVLDEWDAFEQEFGTAEADE